MNPLAATQPTAEPRLFADLSTDELLARAIKTDGGRCAWHLWDRAMLLAFFHNRHGKYVPQDA